MTGKAYHFEGTWECGECHWTGDNAGRTPEELCVRLRAALDRHRAKKHPTRRADSDKQRAGASPARSPPAEGREGNRT